MKRLVIVIGLAALLFGGLAMPASAKGKEEAPAQVCKPRTTRSRRMRPSRSR